ncbi:MAG: PHP domain-containing protein [Eubacteriaceae bacterium]|nr:PHP domain-containing protein [Eubacteriaceae bacterium]
MRYADLHIHSNHSDGVLTPETIIKIASEKNLKAISITDHDNFSGVLEAKTFEKKYGVEVITGIEFSCSSGTEDIHILGYFDSSKTDAIEEILKDLRKHRLERAYQMAEKFKASGIHLDFEDIFNSSASVGRPHFAKALVSQGYSGDTKEAFAKYLHTESPYYVPKKKLTCFECNDMIHAHKGLSVIAHPAVIKAKYMIGDLIKEDIDGLEVYHPLNTSKDRIELYNLCKENKRLVTGGSDFHGNTANSIVQIGTCKIPYTYVEALMDKLASIS